jgi:hypothetical protein
LSKRQKSAAPEDQVMQNGDVRGESAFLIAGSVVFVAMAMKILGLRGDGDGDNL